MPRCRSITDTWATTHTSTANDAERLCSGRIEDALESSYLTRFPLNRIKIDRSFVRHLSESASAALVSSIISMAGSLQLSCIAEGVETTDQLHYLRKQKCTELQGYLFSPALPPAECAALLGRFAQSMAGIT